MEDAKTIGDINQMELLKLTDNTLTEDEIDAQMETVEGIGLLAYLSLRYAHIGISKEQVMGIVLPSRIEEIMAAMFPAIKKKPENLIRKPAKRKRQAKPLQ